MPLSELGELDRGRSRHRPRNDPKLFGSKYPFIQTGDVSRSGGTISEATAFLSDFGLAQSRLWPTGTVCITIAANIAESAVLAVEACFPDSVVGLVVEPQLASGRYVEYFVRTARGELDRYAPATAQKNINLEVLRSVMVPVAPREEQEELVSRIGSAFGLAEHFMVDVSVLAALERSLLAKAFRGELDLDGTDSEVVRLNEAAAGARAKGEGGRRTA